MKREASQQHGMLRTHGVLPFPWNPEPETEPSKAKANVPSNPSNYNSKFSGTCGKPNQCLGCHLNPVCTSKDKTKGTQNCRTRNVVVCPGLITWRVVDKRLGLNFSGFSATGILEHLHDIVNGDDEIGNHANDDDDDDGNNDDGVPCGLLDDDYMAHFWSLHEKKNDDDDDDMSFCDVGFMMEQTEEDEDWCLLREI